MKRKCLKLYICIILGILIILGSSIFWGNGININEENITAPQIIKDGKLNENFLDECEDFVSKKYAFRNGILEAYTQIMTEGFNKSPVDDVILGENGFLYFKDTLADYEASRKYSNREVFQIKKTIELMDEYVKSKDGKFILLVAPNKNTIYDNMPNYYKKGKFENKGIRKVTKKLENINYIDIYNLFKHKDEILYYKTDTHWNNKGAYLVYSEVMNSLGVEVKKYSEYKIQKTKIKGDLYNMLFPNREANEESKITLCNKKYKYLTKTRSTEQGYIETINHKGNGSLLMFRDSFANNLIPYFSNEFKYAIYDKKIPYDLNEIDKYKSDVVILEIAERNIKNIQSNKPKFIAPKREKIFDASEKVKFVKEVKLEKNCITGVIDKKYLEENSEIFIKVKDQFYELTPQMIDGQYGFCGYLDENIDKYELYLVNSKKVLVF